MRQVKARKQEPRQKTAKREPLTEGITISKRGREWSRMSNAEIIDYAEKFLAQMEGKTRKDLERADFGLYIVLYKRGLLDDVAFERKHRKYRYWKEVTDIEIIKEARRILKEKGISTRSELEQVDKGLYGILNKRRLLNKIGLKVLRRQMRNWKKFDNEALVEYARKLIEKKGIKSIKNMEEEDRGLLNILRKRKLLGILGFERKMRKRRNWKKFNKEELIEHAIAFMKERQIIGREELSKADNGLYKMLWRRNLLDIVFSSLEQSKLLTGLSQAADAMEQFGGAG
jgi:hypothetical protein